MLVLFFGYPLKMVWIELI